MAEIGKRGYAVTIARYPDFHIVGGQAAWRKANLLMLEAGYFPTQSRRQWGYCQQSGCSQPSISGSFYCSRHQPN